MAQPSGSLAREINPLVPIGVGVLIVLLIAFFGFIKPKIEADRALRDFNSAEAQARRDPDQRKVSDTYKAKRDELLAKETHRSPGGASRRRRE
jgi:hypothetical protein